MSNRKSRLPNAVVAGENVYLKKPAARDAKEFISLNRDSVKLHRGWVAPPIRSEQFATFLKRCRESDSASFLICRIADDRIVGAINLSQIFLRAFRSAYLGYYIGAPYAGRGYMTEAIRLMLRYAFKHLKLHRVEANIRPENSHSIALVKRAGFRLEGYSPRYLKINGRWRDHERWAILFEDWKKL